MRNTLYKVVQAIGLQALKRCQGVYTLKEAIADTQTDVALT